MSGASLGRLVHLQGGGVSVVLSAGEDQLLPVVLHWGASLGDRIDGEALAEALAPPVPHSAPDVPVVRRLLPMPLDGWRLRPGLQGAHTDGGHWSPRFAVRETVVDEPRSARFVVADDRAGLRLVISLQLHESGVLEVNQLLRNEGTGPYGLVELAATLPLPPRAQEILDLTGRWTRERTPQRHRLLDGVWVREGRHGRTGHDAPVVLAVGTPGFGFRSGEIWAQHLGWSGDSTYWAERNPQGYAQLGAAELLAPGEIALAPGESYAAPPLYAVHTKEGLDGVSRAYHQFIRARPTHPTSPRPVVLNTWEAVYFDHNLDRLVRLADIAAAIGVERYVLDDGWFADRRHDMAGLGDWHVSPDAWPQGLDPLIKHVRALGMQFGLWVEPEMVNPDSDLYRAHPDWILSAGGRLPMPWRHQQLLDLANPEVYAHILERLDTLLRDHDIAYLKWDHNRDLIDAGHGDRPGVHAQTVAVYALLDELRRRHPGVEIESCASGGGRVDLGILARTDRVWASDTNDALERQTIQRWTAQLLPPELIGAHVGGPTSHTTGRTHTLSFRIATALFGHFGIEWDLTAVSPTEQAHLREAIAFYKRIRSLLQTGETVRLDAADPAVYLHGCVAADKSEAVFAYVHLAASATETSSVVQLPGLADDRDYRVTVVPLAGGPTTHEVRPPAWVAAGGITLRGRSLAVVGLQMPILVPEQALILHVTEDVAA
ncbi:MAG TPA: alpha-galactosidase [Jiangellales bacterium]|nr:alpha-galactosidase [Jiangellales bacterium]